MVLVLDTGMAACYKERVPLAGGTGHGRIRPTSGGWGLRHIRTGAMRRETDGRVPEAPEASSPQSCQHRYRTTEWSRGTPGYGNSPPLVWEANPTVRTTALDFGRGRWSLPQRTEPLMRTKSRRLVQLDRERSARQGVRGRRKRSTPRQRRVVRPVDIAKLFPAGPGNVEAEDGNVTVDGRPVTNPTARRALHDFLVARDPANRDKIGRAFKI